MTKSIDIIQSRNVWIPWTNEDKTEGKGASIPVAVCKCEATALRLGSGEGVMSSNAPVREHMAYLIGTHWYAPVHLVHPIMVDDREQKYMDNLAAAQQRMKQLGVTDEDIELVTGRD